MSKKPADKISGRAVADEKGNQKWVWQSEGEKAIDTAVVKALGEGLSLEDEQVAGKPAGAGSNPYDRAKPYDRVPPPGDPPAKRRTLDDMRKLSEAIKASKQKTGRS
ncbi:MAG: hypothetical protein JSR66_17285 [Proteobacteria bacterium]|nr:hypothetical protein [Pseudomonadota bacterium]